MSQTTYKKILIVEDEPFLLDVYKFAFECAGYQVLTAQSRGKALEIIKTSRPDLILLDVIIPEKEEGLVDYTAKEGFQLLRELKKDNLKEIPVIVFSNLDYDHSAESTFKEMNVLDYIIKANFSPKQLVSRVGQLV
ncbi:MAG TPA: response regulator [Patescibacteria group bacterium]